VSFIIIFGTLSFPMDVKIVETEGGNLGKLYVKPHCTDRSIVRSIASVQSPRNVMDVFLSERALN